MYAVLTQEHYGDRTTHPECAEELNKEPGFIRSSPKKMAYEVNPDHGQQSTAVHDEYKKMPNDGENPNSRR